MAITTFYESRVEIPEDIFHRFVFSPMDKDYERMSIEAAAGSIASETDFMNREEVATFDSPQQAELFESKMKLVFDHFSATNSKAVGLA